MSKQYIGDGVYVSDDGFQILLETERENGTDKIYLEPQVFEGLCQYVARIWGVDIIVKELPKDDT